jgi:hypothetical protein
MATGAMVLPEGCEYTVRKGRPTLEPGEVPSALSKASEFTRAMYATRKRRGRRLPVITFPRAVSAREIADELFRAASAGARVSGLRLEAEIQADLEYGR